MSSEEFTKYNLDFYLKELAKEYKRLGGKSMPAELILVGGAAVLTNYGFRDMTTDIDAVIYAASSMKEAINNIGDRFDLPNGWLNADFMKTASYSLKLEEVSVYYKTFYGVLSVRTISDVYLIAMKLRSGRLYKSDRSDIVGILLEHKKRGLPIDLKKIESAVLELYGSWDGFSEESKKFISDVLKTGNLEKSYMLAKDEEMESRASLIRFEKDYPKALKVSNVNDILKLLKAKSEK